MRRYNGAWNNCILTVTTTTTTQVHMQMTCNKMPGPSQAHVNEKQNNMQNFVFGQLTGASIVCISTISELTKFYILWSKWAKLFTCYCNKEAAVCLAWPVEKKEIVVHVFMCIKNTKAIAPLNEQPRNQQLSSESRVPVPRKSSSDPLRSRPACRRNLNCLVRWPRAFPCKANKWNKAQRWGKHNSTSLNGTAETEEVH